MRISLRIFGIILICFWSCKNPNDKTESITDQKVAILLNSEQNKWLEENYGLKKWTPTGKDLNIVQEVLDKAIHNKEFDFLKKPTKQSVEKYYRQYIPYINENGERIIEINAFCEILENPPENRINEWTKLDWRTEYVIVDDGGDCYWQITINLDTKKYNNLMVNGEA
ncbi:hypothetical protein [Salinimicrobium sp. HB62]|uniref:hypothetical protein n=1 Tax=Salinimicrobium sp. HB62 TaxID=3077781 RepID=UPI002D792315|nr:hypothetical protein [Salinimicrobium sp. HB62]